MRGQRRQRSDRRRRRGNWNPAAWTPTEPSRCRHPANLANHTHNTARAEALYALLVEGQGPLGTVFNRDDFTDKEVQDTDGDGLPEFVDAWGEPLQFYRWPIYYHSDLQRGVPLNNNFNASGGGRVRIGRRFDELSLHRASSILASRTRSTRASN